MPVFGTVTIFTTKLTKLSALTGLCATLEIVIVARRYRFDFALDGCPGVLSPNEKTLMDIDRIPTLKTPRLTLRAFSADDLTAYYEAVTSDADVMRYLPGGVPRTLDRTRETLKSFIDGWRTRDYSGFAVIDTVTGALIGQAGLWPVTPADGEGVHVEVFYALAKAAWGQGLAAEAARAVVADGFERVGLPEIIAVAYPANTASQRVMAKIGMQSQGLSSRYYNTEMALYSIRREVWQAAKTATA